MINLISERVESFLAEDDGQAIVMLNLLRFRADGGRERYGEYIAMAAPLVARYGGEVLYVGEGLDALAAEDGQAWDAVALVRYPDRGAFAAMIADPDYRETAPVRASALEEGVLQPTLPNPPMVRD